MTAIDRVAEFISDEGLLSPKQRVVAAVSGGPDSLALLISLRELGYRPLVAHLDHGLRPESAAEASYVRELAASWGLACLSEKADPSDWAGSTEEAARIARYSFLFRVAKEEGRSTIVTGHTRDDQVETLLLRLLRGAGPQGLAGMKPATDLSRWTEMEQRPPKGGRLVRPLLCLRRQETVAICREQGLEPRQDVSNLDPSFLRNQLRLELLPLLRQYNPGIDEVLARTSDVMRGVAAWMEAELDERWPRLAREAGAGALALRWEELQAMPLALRRQAIHRALEFLSSPDRPLEFSVVERAIDHLAGEGGAIATLVGDLRLERAGGEAVILRRGAQPRFPQVPQLGQEEPIELGLTHDLLSGWSLRVEAERLEAAERTAILAGRKPYADADTEALDQSAIEGQLALRRPRRGDRIQPLGMEGQMTLSDFFINEKVPRLQRGAWPLLVDETGILWVVGLRLAARGRVREGTSHVLWAKLKSVSDFAQG